MTEARDAVPDLDRKIRVFPAFDAFQKVGMLAFGIRVKMNPTWFNDRIQDLR